MATSIAVGCAGALADRPATILAAESAAGLFGSLIGSLNLGHGGWRGGCTLRCII